MSEFKAAYEVVMANEGGYVNVSTDKGGETYAGVSRRWHPNWQGWPIVDKNKPLKRGQHINDVVLSGMVKAFYKLEFWDKMQGDYITSQRVATFIFDWLVTSWDEAVKALQKVAGVAQDGRVGNLTVAAINARTTDAQDEDAVMDKLKALRIAYYKSLKDPINEAGWINRVNKF